MAIRRRDFLKSAGVAAASLGLPRLARGTEAASIYDLERFGHARILHITDTHAQLNPVYFREPSVNIGIGEMAGRRRRIWSAAPFSSGSESGPTAPMPMPSPASSSRSLRRASASSVALPI
ncbi:hypothetical protein ACVMHR_008047 [Bradyrhizobium diazoefficiens]